jgi:hypothetical protein
MLPRITARLVLLCALASPLLWRLSVLWSRVHAGALSRASWTAREPLRSIRLAAAPPVGKTSAASKSNATGAKAKLRMRSRLLSPDAKTRPVYVETTRCRSSSG